MHYLISECCDAIPDHEHVSQITGEERHQGICSDCMPEIVDEVAYLLRLAYNNYESREQDIDPVQEMKENYMYNQTVKPWNAKRD